ncbi:MAG: hypothetical protein KatS3mg060_2923 [Dehalococcoidia bacterium]|nr:MAG: hypothetical protein KatS3mg060_2923 [Dehalococcoidia bacterium]
MQANRTRRGHAALRPPRPAARRFRQVLAAPVLPMIDGIVEQTAEPVLVVSLDGNVRSWNSAAERLYGYRAGEMIGQPITRLTPPGQPTDLAMALDRYLRGLQPAPFEAVRLGKHGKRVDVLVTLAPIRSRAGRLLGLVVVHRALPARQSVADRLRGVDDAIRVVLEDIPVGVQWLAADGTILWANRAQLEMLGYPADEYFGQSVAAFATDPEAFRALVARLDAGEQLRNAELNLRAKDGSVRTMLVSSDVRSAGGQLLHARWLCIDITDRAQSERAIREDEQRLRAIVDGTAVLIWSIGPDGKLTFVNRAWLAFTGRTLEEAIGNGWIADVHPDDVPTVLDRFRNAVEQREPYRGEYRLRRHDGIYRWVLDTAMPVFSPQRDFAGYVGVAIDITELRDIADERQRVAAREARVEGVLLTAREMSHLVINSITGAIGSLELLAHDPTDQRYHALIPGALAGLENAARYLRELQNIVRVETKQTPVGEALDLERSTAVVEPAGSGPAV